MLEVLRKRSKSDSSDPKLDSALRQRVSQFWTSIRSVKSSQSSLTETPPRVSLGSLSTFDLAMDMFIHSGEWSRPRGTSLVLPVFTCSQLARSSPNTSPSTDGSPSEQTSPKKRPQKSHERRTTITSTTSDTSSWLLMIFLRWRVLQRYLMPSNEWWLSTLEGSLSSQQKTLPSVLYPTESSEKRS